jgi:hypothetical protein
VNSPVRAFRGVGGDPVFFKSGQGAWLTDVDGNRYVDYVCSWGPLIAGHAHPDVIGRVSRLCLSLGVVPVFVVPHEFGFQSTIENYNGTWQAKVWARFEHGALADLQGRSQRYVTALRRHRADRIEAAPRRRAFPTRWRLDLQSRPKGRIIYLRRTGAVGAVEVMGRSFEGDPHWLNRLVRVEVDLDGDKIRIYRLRRREPQDQPLLREVDHHIKKRKFSE